jgi:uncharacterized protein (DUF488 family)
MRRIMRRELNDTYKKENPGTSKKIFTIGHSLTKIEDFISLLAKCEVKVLIDVRTYPRSNRARQFNQASLIDSLRNVDIEYLYRGNNLGGYGENIDYEKTINQIANLAQTTNLVLMCSEGNPKKCHRYSLLTPEFQKRGFEVVHLEAKSVNQLFLL